jgi:hypothetical protein
MIDRLEIAYMTELMGKLNRLFDNILGCSVEFFPAENFNEMLGADSWNADDIATLRGPVAGLPKYIESDESNAFGFPVNIQGKFAGLAVVRGFQNAKHSRLMLLAELMTMMLESGFRSEDRKDRLRMIEERIALLDENSNVIPLRPARYGRVMEVNEMQVEAEAVKTPVTTTPLLLESSASFPLQRIAIEIHQMSDRWAMVGANDLPAEVFASRESLKELGNVTIFIRDLTTLTINQQLKLAEYLGSQPGLDMPHVIAGINTNALELEAAGLLLPHLTRAFTSVKLQWTDKPAEQITRDLINATIQHIMSSAKQNTHAVGDHFIPFHIQYFQNDENHAH